MNTAKSSASVLIVEDNRDLCENLAEILSAVGYRVEEAVTARAGRERLREARPDVALVDLNLPDGRGIELLAEARRVSPDTACIVLTGNATLESAVEAVNQGAYAYLLKGGRIEEVMVTVGRAAEKVRLEREKEHLERLLREERNFSRAIVSNAALGIAVLARDGRVLVLNRQMRELLGPQGDLDHAEALASLARTPAHQERLREALAGGPAARDIEVTVERPDRQGRTWKISTSTVQGEGGRLEAVVAVFVDVTEERELQRKVVLGSRLAAIGEMAARVAHEIRNPLAGIAGALRVLGRGLENDPKGQAYARELQALVGRLNGFVEDLLVYARPIKITKEDVRLAAALDPMLTVLRENPIVRDLDIRLVDRLGRPFKADRHFFAMAIQNLVLNAAQALKGQGTIWIEAGPGKDDGAAIRVADDGPGLPMEVVPHLFEAFATTRIEGTGLGLSTTRRIVEAHGGTIGGGNRPEGGARFEIWLPA